MSNTSPKSDVALKTCDVFGRCGACSHLDVPYQEQLAQKHAEIEQLFAPLNTGVEVAAPLGMSTPYHYRTKVISPFAPAKDAKDLRRLGKNARTKSQTQQSSQKKHKSSHHTKDNMPEILTGMYEKGTHRLIPEDHCLLEDKRAQGIVPAIRHIMKRYGMEPYDEDTGNGFVRHVVIRVGHDTSEILVTLVTNGETFPASKAFCRELVTRCPQVTSVVQNINTRQTNVVLGEKERRLYGPGFILDRLGALTFRLSSQSFYQVNPQQALVLYQQAIASADLRPQNTLIDAYCGTGTIGLMAAKLHENDQVQVIGVDSVDAAIRDARMNASHNGVDNAEFHQGDAGQFLSRWVETGELDPDKLVVMMDPPRAGSTQEFLSACVKAHPRTIVYISCNPKTQVRDVSHLVEQGYQITAIQPVDMFPHTDHIENIVTLTREDCKSSD